MKSNERVPLNTEYIVYMFLKIIIIISISIINGVSIGFYAALRSYLSFLDKNIIEKKKVIKKNLSISSAIKNTNIEKSRCRYSKKCVKGLEGDYSFKLVG